MNVVVVVIDALRASDVGCLGREDDVTPNIDALAEDSLVFERAFAVSNYTDVCMTTIMSGKTPREHGVTHHGTAHTDENLTRIEERSPTFLPEILHANGYETIGVDWMGRWHEWGYDHYGVSSGGRDIDETPDSIGGKLLDRLKSHVVDLPDPVLTPIMKQYHRRVGYGDFRVDCEDLTDIAIERIDRSNEPFFALVHYWDVHPPYLPPAEYESRFTYDGEDEALSKYFGSEAKGPLSAEFPPYARGEHTTLADSKEAYDGAIRWVDDQLGRLFAYLRRENLMEDTMVVVTADHGHNFGEHGIFSDNCGLYDTSLHVPLVVHHPHRGPERVGGLVQHTDIVPTILESIDLDIPDDLRGNVLPETHEHVFAEAIEHRMQMIRTDEWKLVVPNDLAYLRNQYWYEGDGEVELYDIGTDPDESRNVAREHPEVVGRFQELLDREIEAQDEIASRKGDRSVEIDGTDMDEIKSRLNALGYADDDNV